MASSKSINDVREIVRFKQEETNEELLKTKIGYLENEIENFANDMEVKGKIVHKI